MVSCWIIWIFHVYVNVKMTNKKNNWIWIIGVILVVMYTTDSGIFKKEGLSNGA